MTPNICKSLESFLVYPHAKDARVTTGFGLLEITAEGQAPRPRPSASLLGLSAGRQTMGKGNFKTHRSPRCTTNRATRISSDATGTWLRVPIESASGAAANWNSVCAVPSHRLMCGVRDPDYGPTGKRDPIQHPPDPTKGNIHVANLSSGTY